MSDVHLHPVLVELGRRRHGQATPGTRLVLAVTGGAMRGVLPAGMLAGLERAGVAPSCFDAIWGVSAGAVGAAYYLAGQARHGVTVYWDHLAPGPFVRFRRLLTPGPVMDLDFLFDEVLTTRVPLDVNAVVAAGTLRVLASSPEAVRVQVLGPATSAAELISHLRASCHVPLLAGEPPQVGAAVLYDGSLIEPIPYRTVLAHGATHVLVLSSTTPSASRRRQSLVEAAVSKLYDWRFPGVHDAIAGQVATSPELRTELFTRTTLPQDPPYVFELAPPPGVDVGSLCRDADRLAGAAQATAAAVDAVLAGVPGT